MRPPPELLSLQSQFTKALLREDETADLWLCGSPGLPAKKRMGIYRESYQTRIIQFLLAHFPLACRFLGRERFCQEITLPYLSDCYSTDWRLEQFAFHLVLWFEKRDPFLLSLLQADLRWLMCSLAKHVVSPIPDLFSTPLALQPHASLIQLEGDLFHLRLESEWRPPREGIFQYLLFRSKTMAVVAAPISEVFYHLLNEKGCSCNEAITRLEEIYPSLDYALLYYSMERFKDAFLVSTSSAAIPKQIEPTIKEI